MGATRYTLLGVLAFVLLSVVVLGVHEHYLSLRAACGNRLQQLVPRLDIYAAHHHGLLPRDANTLRQALGGQLLLSTIDGLPYRMETSPLSWKSGPAHPYLWDPLPHPFVNGVHVLYTDGHVRLVEDVLREMKSE